jgi:glycosyltransferase involved in cell wall biosynthesis
MKPADVCIFSHGPVSHDTRVLNEAASLGAAGYEVAILALSLSGEMPTAVERHERLTIYHRSPRLLRKALPGTSGKIVRLLFAIPALALDLHRIDARVYQAQKFIGLLTMACCGIWRRPIVYDMRELFFDQWPPSIRYPLKRVLQVLRPLERFLCRRAAATLAEAQPIAEHVEANLGVPRPILVHTTVDLQKTGVKSLEFDVRARRVIAHSGNLVEARNLPELVRAVALLPEDIGLVLMGDGPLRGELEALARALGVQERFLIAPPVRPADVAPTLAQADAAAVLVRPDGIHYDLTIAVKFFEAIAAGLPLLCGSTTATRRLVESHTLGVLCDPEDPAAIAAAARELLEPENLKRFKVAVRRARDEQFNWRVDEERLLSVYRPLLDSTPTAGAATSAEGPSDGRPSSA